LSLVRPAAVNGDAARHTFGAPFRAQVGDYPDPGGLAAAGRTVLVAVRRSSSRGITPAPSARCAKSL